MKENGKGSNGERPRLDGMLVIASKERTQRIFMDLVCFWTSLCGQWVPVEPPDVLVALPMRSVGFDVAGTMGFHPRAPGV